MSPKLTPTYYDGTTPRVCIVGGGVAGICAGVQLKRKLNLNNFVIFEKANEFGGVWLANTYPGCETDVAGLVYSYSFAPNPGWSKVYPDRDQMWAYLKGVARRYHLYSHVQFNTEVSTLIWNDTSKTWAATIRSVGSHVEQTLEFEVVILGTGAFREPNYPRIFDGFSGPKFHSAEWDANVQLGGKVVGVVGSGSSAIQIVPALASKVKEMIVYVRDPVYVIPNFQASFCWISKQIIRLVPILIWFIRALIFLDTEILVSTFNLGNFIGKVTPFFADLRLRLFVRDASVRSKLMPRYSVGYKFPSFGNASYFKAFNRSNLQLIRSPILKCEDRAITTIDGSRNTIDVLVLCTGFKLLEFFAPMRIIGAHGIDLLRLWKTSRPETFYGITTHQTPNMFFIMGPNGMPLAKSVMFMVECQVEFIINGLRSLMTRNAGSICVKSESQTKCMEEIDRAARNKVYMRRQLAENCVGGTNLVNENGFPIFWPMSNTTYWLRTRRLDNSKFEFTSRHANENLATGFASITIS